MIFNVNSGKGKDENLLPENIKNGVVIDDVVGTLPFCTFGSVKGSGSYTITIAHNLGKKPTFFALATGSLSSAYKIYSALYSAVGDSSHCFMKSQTTIGYKHHSEGTASVTSTHITLSHDNDSYTFYGSNTYYWIAY